MHTVVVRGWQWELRGTEVADGTDSDTGVRGLSDAFILGILLILLQCGGSLSLYNESCLAVV